MNNNLTDNINKEPLIAPVPDGRTTHTEYEYFFEWRSDLFDEATVLIERDYVNGLDERQYFLDGVAKQLRALGSDPDNSDDNTSENDQKEYKIYHEVVERYKKILGTSCPKAVRKWLTGEAVPSDINRENNYDLCLALEMSFDEIVEFFLKSYLLIPFNFKDKTDAVYYYALRNNKSFAEIKKLLAAADGITLRSDMGIDTVSCGRRLREMSSDKELLAYISEYCRDKRYQYTTARRRIKELALENMKMSSAVRGGRIDDAKFIKDLWKAMMGFSATDEAFSISKSRLPKRFKYSFPNEQQLGNFIRSDGAARVGVESFELIRKTLILMNFYNYYKSAEKIKNRSSAVIKELIADFYAQTNLLMAECGFVQMYLRHPYDWLILFCANSPDPLAAFRDIFAEELDREDDNSDE